MALHFSGFGGGSSRDSYGFEKPDNFDEAAYSRFISDYLPVLARRSRQWNKLLVPASNPNPTLPQGILAEKKLKRFIRKGIPLSLRPKLWPVLTGAEERMHMRKGEFSRLSNVVPSQEASDAIDLDLNRTFPDNQYFQEMPTAAKNDLYHILHVVAVKHPAIGYCQGLNYLAGMLLLILKSAEKAFWVLDAMLLELPDYYTKGMRGLQVDVMVLRELLRQRSPEMDAFLQKMDLDLMLMTSKWFLCWFLETLPMETVLRIWDCLFNEGAKILFRVALTLLLKNKERLLRCSNFVVAGDVFKSICTNNQALDCHKFLHDVCITSVHWLRLQDMFVLPGSLSGKTVEALRQEMRAKLKPIQRPPKPLRNAKPKQPEEEESAL